MRSSSSESGTVPSPSAWRFGVHLSTGSPPATTRPVSRPGQASAQVGRAPLLVATALDPDPLGPGQGGRDDGVGAVAGPDGVDRLGGVVPRRGLDVVEAQLAGGVVAQLAHVDPEQPDARGGVDRARGARRRPGSRRGRCRRRSGSVTTRVMVRKSSKRTLIDTVRPAIPAARSRLATESPRRTSSWWRVSRRWWSRAKVSSWPIDLARWSGTTARSSSPWPAATGGRRWRRRGGPGRPARRGRPGRRRW